MTALRDRDYRNLWLAGLISEVGDWLLLVALPILVYQLTGSTLGTAIAFLVELVPPIALGAVAGRLADRWNHRRALVWLSVAQAAALLPLLAAHDRDDLWIVYAVITMEAGLATFTEPTRNAMLPTITPAEHLAGANSLLALTSNIGRLVGGPLGGLLLGFGDLATIVLVDAVSFGLAAVLFTRIRTGVREPDDPTGADNPTGDDPRRVRAGLIMAGLAAVAQGMFVVLFVPFVARALDGGAAETGLLRGVQAIGAIAGGLALGVLASRFRPGVLAVVGAAGFAVLDAVIWNAPEVTTARPLYIVLFAVIGAPGVVLITGLVTSLQRAVAPGRVGRVFGLFTAVSAGGQAVGMLAAGLLGDRVGVVAVLNVQAGLYLLAALVAAVGLVGPRTAPGTDGSPGAVKDPRQGTTPVGGDGGRR